ncbi:unnamed protein product [Lactuca virosa]|uniref:Xanthoxin dehydrogenase n=1 Tax=Lactuca virosa TaxID=75947 RepID=A0AAU9P8Y3_9ASTR|nr:unnamed protein product [Lactuca virosa]
MHRIRFPQSPSLSESHLRPLHLRRHSNAFLHHCRHSNAFLHRRLREIEMTTAGPSDSPLVAQRLLGKVALVTGGATGIGESIVRLFHKHGAKVCIVDINSHLGEHLSKSLGPTTRFIHADVAIEDDISRAVDFTISNFGTLDIMVNNAGMGGPPCPDIREFPISTFEQVFNVNTKGTFIGMKHASRIMIPLKKGSIVNIASVASVIGGVGPHAYTASKHAVVGLTKSVAAELGKHGIRVNCVSPYAVLTDLALAHLHEDERTDDAKAGFRAFSGKNANLQGVELVPDDVANAVLFLASDDARTNKPQNQKTTFHNSLLNPPKNRQQDLHEFKKQSGIQRFL